ncbi:hypothetical protein FEM48_Zijuj06G0164800 [Ziziphus jujuba var. spinosa]|uniref:Uncharacterized protein n=1 Tax=Ziziphus jujuba var. spinosa TaxID=714518 RepID=A0A978VAD3_ZIZJJ|nr:hypothetical protein FEM48_Zijuj06G0164800 [Ziziphus jujuba var. spinosa]
MDSLEEILNSMFFHHCNSDESSNRNCFQYQSDDDESQDPAERNFYWESQRALLQEVLERHSLTGAKLRQEITQTIEKAKSDNKSKLCNCLKPKKIDIVGCNNCLRRRVVDLLCDKGFTATLCTSKWRDTKKFPRGTHEYIEVIGNTPSRIKQVPFLVEVEFRDQFEIAKASEEYKKLVGQLPECYIGKPNYLNTIVRLVCKAAKRSMKEKKIHMGPWRKRSFMLMKWSPSFEKWAFMDSSNKSMPRQPHDSCSLQCAAPTAVVVT